MKKVIVEKMEDWDLLVTEILQLIKNDSEYRILALSGDLGVGKTTFVQALARSLGVTEVVTSPTYTIVKKYQVAPLCGYSQLIHMDAYRINTISELRPLRFVEMIQDETALFCIEWAEQIKEALPKKVIYIAIKQVAGETREVTLEW